MACTHITIQRVRPWTSELHNVATFMRSRGAVRAHTIMLMRFAIRTCAPLWVQISRNIIGRACDQLISKLHFLSVARTSQYTAFTISL